MRAKTTHVCVLVAFHESKTTHVCLLVAFIHIYIGSQMIQMFSNSHTFTEMSLLNQMILESLKIGIAEIATKHGVEVNDILDSCIIKYYDQANDKVFYHHQPCSCGQIFCSYCNVNQKASGHSLLEENMGDPSYSWLRHTKFGQCGPCVSLRRVYNAQCETVFKLGHMFSQGNIDKTCKNIRYRFTLQRRLAAIFGGTPVIKVNGAKVSLETAEDVMRNNNYFE